MLLSFKSFGIKFYYRFRTRRPYKKPALFQINLYAVAGADFKNFLPRDFFKIGIPFTLVAVLGGYGFIWLVFGI